MARIRAHNDICLLYTSGLSFCQQTNPHAIYKGAVSYTHLVVFALPYRTLACTNFLVTRGASVDGSTMITYSADSHYLYGELYHWPAALYAPGTLLKIYEWDSGRYLGEIPQALQTYSVIGKDVYKRQV